MGAGLKVRCKVCHAEIQSMSRHDFVACECDGNNVVFVDGGDCYFRFGGDLSQVEIEVDGKWIEGTEYFKADNPPTLAAGD